MSFTNFVSVDGNLTRDAEIKYSPSGTAFANFTVAHNRKIKDRDEAYFLDVTAIGKHAEAIADRLKKGTAVLVVGHLRQRRWEDDRGGKRSKVEIMASQVTFVGTMPRGDVLPEDVPDIDPF
jgi:single-strand DNA-binding protein